MSVFLSHVCLWRQADMPSLASNGCYRVISEVAAAAARWVAASECGGENKPARPRGRSGRPLTDARTVGHLPEGHPTRRSLTGGDGRRPWRDCPSSELLGQGATSFSGSLWLVWLMMLRGLSTMQQASVCDGLV